jgi:hypothetical protein
VLMDCEHVDLLRACTAASYRASSPSTFRPLVSSMRAHGGHRIATGGRCARVQVGQSRAGFELADVRGGVNGSGEGTRQYRVDLGGLHEEAVVAPLGADYLQVDAE